MIKHVSKVLQLNNLVKIAAGNPTESKQDNVQVSNDESTPPSGE